MNTFQVRYYNKDLEFEDKMVISINLRMNLDRLVVNEESPGILKKFFRKTTKCNIMIRNNGKLVSYKTLENTFPDLYNLIKELPPM